MKELIYLGRVILEDGILVDKSNVEAVQSYVKQRNTTDIRTFLWTNFYQKFIHGFADNATPLNSLLVKGTNFCWNEACPKAFDKLKQLINEAPILVLPNFNKTFFLYTDAPRFSILIFQGGKMLQSEYIVVAYGGRAFRPADRNCPISKKACLALIQEIKHYRIYIANKTFQIFTDDSFRN